ncbi:RRP12-like protein isoform X2 [Arachis ipaensis]|uniref:RRP12-like protein isoform X2 n=1 Tax=Arachis ipaensis TaxID=130454 RepID=UPI000A2AFD01|nr:RRP12-like protein isoform X2 [Arachis ipaensis]XP_029147744.1 RRP12-like protein isoform X2 [Arachis hypogaea]
MDDFEMDAPSIFGEGSNDDFCDSILSRLSGSTKESHLHLCAVVGAMSQELKDQKLPSSPVAYFGAACSSLDRISVEPDPPSHVIGALLTVISLLIPRVPAAVLKKQREFLSGLVERVLRSLVASEIVMVSGLKCLSHLLIRRDSVDWSDVSRLFNELLRFLTDSQPKVRRQSHLCLRDVLLNFQNSSLLASASEGVRKLLQRSILLAGGADANASEGTVGAQQVLYILDALKESLPFLSLNDKTTILQHYKKLLDLHQPLVTRRITDGLSFLCLYPTSEVPPDPLLELLCSLAHSISSNETSGDGMTFTSTARLLATGMNKIYLRNRDICVVKLPLVFNALKDILASEHEEAIYAATDAFKSMINSCIDARLIMQGVDQISCSNDREPRKSGPTIIEKCCATIESLLDYHYIAVRDRVLQVVSAMFNKLGNSSPYFMRGILKNLVDVQKLHDEDFPFKKQLHECFGSALAAMGPERLLSFIPLNLEAEDLSDANIWLFPILKQYIIGARLNYFKDEILPMIERIREKARKLEKQGFNVSSRNADALAYSLWSLLPSFCNYPVDTAECFVNLQGHLCREIKEEPDVRGIICNSLQLLIQQNKNAEEANNTDFDGQDMDKQGLVCYSQQVAKDNLNVLKSSAKHLLVALADVFLKPSKDDGGCLQRTIGDIASIADNTVVGNLLIRRMREMGKRLKDAGRVDNSQNFSSMQIDEASKEISSLVIKAQYVDFAVSLLPGLTAEGIDALYDVIKPALKDAEGVMQKKAYKALSIILKDSLEDLWRKDVEVFLVEIIIAVKEVNKKTRNRAYDILVQIGHVLGDEERGGNSERLREFFDKIAGGLGGKTSHMISAAAKSLARLLYEFSDLVFPAFDWLKSTYLQLPTENREIIKANLGLLKVLVVKSQAEWLKGQPLQMMVEGLLKWQNSTKNHFKAKVKLLLGMLVTKCGLGAVKDVIPEEHRKLLTNIRKIQERKERKRGAKSEETKSHLSKATKSRQSMWNHTKIFSDFDEESGGSDVDYLNAKTISGRGRPAATSMRSNTRLKKNLPEHLSDESDDEPLDLLDRKKTWSALRSSEHLKRKSRSEDDEMELDPHGRLIIHEEGKQRKEKPAEPEYDARSEPDSHLSGKSGTKAQKRRKTSDSGWAYTGKEYASKKARGDVKRKDKLEPYAYWPLDRKMMSRRPQQRAAARKGMSSVVKMAKKFEGKSASGVLSMKSLKLKKKGSKKKM